MARQLIMNLNESGDGDYMADIECQFQRLRRSYSVQSYIEMLFNIIIYSRVVFVRKFYECFAK